MECFNKAKLSGWKESGIIREMMEQMDELSKWIMLKKKYDAFSLEEQEIVKHIESDMRDMLAQIVKSICIYGIDMEKK